MTMGLQGKCLNYSTVSISIKDNSDITLEGYVEAGVSSSDAAGWEGAT